jgi:hypothetical protein
VTTYLCAYSLSRVHGLRELGGGLQSGVHWFKEFGLGAYRLGAYSLGACNIGATS